MDLDVIRGDMKNLRENLAGVSCGMEHLCDRLEDINTNLSALLEILKNK
jgi:hypothetical protein